MPYLAASPWQIRSAIRAYQGLGDASISIPAPTVLDPYAANSQIAGDIAAGLPLTSTGTGTQNLVTALTNLFSGASTAAVPTTSLPAQEAAALTNIPSTSGVNWLEWGLIGGGVLILLLALSSGGRRRR